MCVLHSVATGAGMPGARVHAQCRLKLAHLSAFGCERCAKVAMGSTAVVIDAGFVRVDSGGLPSSVLEPYLTVAVPPDEVWHAQCSELLFEHAFQDLNVGDAAPVEMFAGTPHFSGPGAWKQKVLHPERFGAAFAHAPGGRRQIEQDPAPTPASAHTPTSSEDEADAVPAPAACSGERHRCP